MNQEHNSQLSEIKPEELRAFQSALEQNGFQKNDFEVKAISERKEEQQSSPKSSSMMENNQHQNDKKCSKIAVKNKKTGKEKTYQAGEGSHWVKNFESDLKNHQF
jgi:hypothetical protein